jgi:putative tryptophan/tyrosine transport system ATP-binding protein
MSNNILVMKNVSYKIQGNLIIDRIDLNVKQEDFIVLVGSNGSGKSSLMKLICRQTQPQQGQIIFNGKDSEHYKRKDYAQQVVMLSQSADAHLCAGMTIEEHLRLYKMGVSNFHEIDDISGYLQQFNRKLPKYIHRPIDNLSGGEKQMLVLALVMLRKPALLLLDEHTAALDPKSSDEVMRLTHKMVKAAGITCIMTTHQVKHMTPYGNRLIAISQGRVLQSLNREQNSTADINHILEQCYA